MPADTDFSWEEQFPSRAPQEGDDYDPGGARQSQFAAEEARRALEAIIELLNPYEPGRITVKDGRIIGGLFSELGQEDGDSTRLPLEIVVEKPSGSSNWELSIWPSVLQGRVSVAENPGNITPTMGGTAIDTDPAPTESLAGQADGTVQNVEMRLDWTDATSGQAEKTLDTATVHVLGAGVAFTASTSSMMVVRLGKITWADQEPTPLNWVTGSPHYAWAEEAAAPDTFIPMFAPSVEIDGGDGTLTIHPGYVISSYEGYDNQMPVRHYYKWMPVIGIVPLDDGTTPTINLPDDEITEIWLKFSLVSRNGVIGGTEIGVGGTPGAGEIGLVGDGVGVTVAPASHGLSGTQSTPDGGHDHDISLDPGTYETLTVDDDGKHTHGIDTAYHTHNAQVNLSQLGYHIDSSNPPLFFAKGQGEADDALPSTEEAENYRYLKVGVFDMQGGVLDSFEWYIEGALPISLDSYIEGTASTTDSDANPTPV